MHMGGAGRGWLMGTGIMDGEHEYRIFSRSYWVDFGW